ncbi:hypothetical_protein [Xanthomonas albilineans GPE PC73]|uniref:Hypothetical_protein n=2 Tax=Xanthomonas albilineans TaxID=29447 RepID=D2UDW2_XANAP|nr:hypothetical_protein [Xanthomonas albilineans GPE PC73]
MAMKMKKRSAIPEPGLPTRRSLWLAGLGLVSLTHRRALAAASGAVDGATSLKARIAQWTDGAEHSVREGAAALRGQVQPLSAEVEARLQPVLVKLGLQATPRAMSRKRAVATKPTARKRAMKTVAAPQRTLKARRA